MKEITRKSKRGQCKTCRKHFFKISQHGNCINCATEKVELARLEIKHRKGPNYDRYLKKMRAALGVEV